MAVTSVSQLGAGRSGTFGKDLHRSYTVVKQVLVDNAYDGALTVVNAAGIVLYSSYIGYENNNDGLALCVDIKPEQDGDEWKKWRVTAQFTTNWQQDNNQNSNPEEDAALFWIETEFLFKKTTKEWDGTPIKNAAGQLIDGLEKPTFEETWVWEKNFSWLNRGVWKEYQNTTNSDQVSEINPYEGLLNIIVPKPSFRDGQPFWKVQFRVKVSTEEDGWRVRPADVGTKFKNSQGKLEAIADGVGGRLDGMAMLKADGSLELDATAEPRYLSHKHLIRPRAFTALGLPYGV